MPRRADTRRASFRVVFRVARNINGEVQFIEFLEELSGPGASLIHGRICCNEQNNLWRTAF